MSVCAGAVELPERAVGAEARVEDHDVRRRAIVERGPAGGQAGVGGQVGHHGARLDPVDLARPAREGAQPLLAPRDDDQRMAARGEGVRVGPAEARRRARDERRPSQAAHALAGAA